MPCALSSHALQTVDVAMNNFLKLKTEMTILPLSHNFYSSWSANENLSNVVNSSIKDSFKDFFVSQCYNILCQSVSSGNP